MDSKNLHFFTFRFLILNSLFSTIYDCQSIHPDAHIYILTAVRTGRKKGRVQQWVHKRTLISTHSVTTGTTPRRGQGRRSAPINPFVGAEMAASCCACHVLSLPPMELIYPHYGQTKAAVIIDIIIVVAVVAFGTVTTSAELLTRPPLGCTRHENHIRKSSNGESPILAYKMRKRQRRFKISPGLDFTAATAAVAATPLPTNLEGSTPQPAVLPTPNVPMDDTTHGFRPPPPPRWQPPCHQITRGGNKKRCAPRLRRSPQEVARLPKRCWPRCWDGPYARAVTCPTRVCPPLMLVRRTGLPLPTPRRSYGHRTYHPPFTRLGTRILPRHSSLPMWKSHPYRRRRRRHTSRPRPASSEPACCRRGPRQHSVHCAWAHCQSPGQAAWRATMILKKKKRKERIIIGN